MRLHRMVVRDFKGIAHRELVFPSSGILVLEGPNEVGKTSLIEALDLLLEHKDSSRRAEIRAARPIGQDVGPFVEIEMSTGPYRFVYRKQWLRRGRTELEVLTPAREEHVGDVAHERVRAILAQTADLHLWKALRLMQATPLEGSDLAGSPALSAALDRAAGASGAESAGEGDSILAAAEEVFLRYFTAKSEAPTGEYRVLIERLDRAEAAVEAAQGALDEVAQDVERHARLDDEIRLLADEAVRARADLDRLEAHWADVEQVAATAAAAQAARDDARRERDLAAARRDERAAAAADLAERAASLAAARDAAEELREGLAPDDARAQDVVRRLEDAVAAEAEAARASAAAREAAQTARAGADLVALAGRLDRVDAATAALHEARAALAGCRVDAAALRRAEDAAGALAVAAARAEAGGARVSVRALGDATPTARVAGADVDLGAGPWESALVEPLSVVVGDVEVALTPDRAAAGRADELGRARADLAAALAPLGVADVEAARAAHETFREHEAAARAAADALAGLLDGDDPDELRARRDALAARLADAGDAMEPLDPADADAAAQAARERSEAARAEVDRLRAAAAQEQEASTSVRVELARAESLAEAVAATVASAQARLAAARQACPDADLDARAAAAQAALDAATAEADRLAELARQEDAEGLKIRVESARAALPALLARRRDLEDDRLRVAARLDQAGSQGRRETYDAACSELEHVRRLHAATHRHAEAARLLRTLLRDESDAARRAYVRPFTEAISRLGRVVYGADFEVEVSDDLAVVSRTLAGRTIPLAQLSTGAKEQLAVLTRLACASVVDPEHGVPVVIDDALGHSDPDKLRRICAAFGGLDGGAQVVLLTCTPGRYAAIAHAQVVRL